MDPTTLVNGEVISTTRKAGDIVIGRDPREVPNIDYYLSSSHRPVVWYVASVFDTNYNEFFRHGMFVLGRSK